MAYITIDPKKLKKNYDYLDKVFRNKNIQWSVVTKLLCGNETFLKELLQLGISQVCDSRITNLKHIKKLNPDVETVYIRPPSSRFIKSIVEFSDISLNTEIETIKLLSAEAIKQRKVHKIIIMIELGELREGVMGDNLIDFYSKVFNLEGIEVVGIGTNLSCLNGVLPNQDKLIQLSLYKQLIEAKFNKKIPFVSGGSSVTIPLIFHERLPKGINHFRVGETLFLGTDVYNDEVFEFMENAVFTVHSRIIELHKKPTVPIGELGSNVTGSKLNTSEKETKNPFSYRAIIDLGLLDVDEKHINPIDESVKIVGASSDMFVVDLGKNTVNYKVGDLIEFKADYMGILRLMNSKYIKKELQEN
ncbi:MAG: alanine racemase [Brumimicrobium sp.]|nr:alanine racemase [Brumimicrobium sp.]